MKTENKIIKTILKENEDFTIREISKKINSDYKITHTAVKRLIKKNIIKTKKIGKSILCSLKRWNLTNEILTAEKERADETNSNIKVLHNEILSKSRTSLFIMILFGSFAKGNYSKNSDIDLLFISNNNDFESRTRTILKLLPLKLHLLFFSEKQFKKMILSHEPNVAKEIINNYIILYGIENFYNLMEK